MKRRPMRRSDMHHSDVFYGRNPRTEAVVEDKRQSAFKAEANIVQPDEPRSLLAATDQLFEI